MKNLSERLKHFINVHTEAKSIREFERKIGWKNSVINNLRDNIASDRLRELMDYLPDLNTEWLLTGQGNMILSPTQKKYKPSGISSVFNEPEPELKATEKSNVTSIPYEDYMEVEFIDLSVQAGPLGRTDLSTLPRNRKMLVPREYDNGEYLVLKVDGNSMYKNGSDISIPAGTQILVKKFYLENGDQLPIRNNLFVIDAKDGQALKQITLHDVENGFIRCHSYNEDYKDYEIRMEDILQIFIYRKVVSSRPPIPDIN